jgi:hypothetical protein
MNKESKDTSEVVVATTTSTPQSDRHTSDEASAPLNGFTQGRPVSPQKIEANRRNAQKSAGPRTEAGKAKASANSYKHGFFAKGLFDPANHAVKDRLDYLALAWQLHEHYQPEGFMEEFWVEKIAIEKLRLRRVMEHEQKLVMSSSSPFEARSLDRTLRNQTALNRQLVAAIKEIDQLQANRKYNAASVGQYEPETQGTIAEVEPPTLSNPELDDAPADNGIDESDPTLVAHEESTASNSNGAAQIENDGTNPPETETFDCGVPQSLPVE